MGRTEVVVELVPDAAAVADHARDVPRRTGRDRRWHGVAVDVLRATSSLTLALEHGAAGVLPFATTAAAIAWRDAHPGALACGERDGRIVAGFDLGNSPSEFSRKRVAGRTLAFASTNGSRAMLSLWGCGRRWLAAFVNVSAAVRALEGAGRVVISCAGKEGAFALEDAACAGWIVRRLVDGGAEAADEAARLCASLAPRDAGEVRALVEGCEHARTLRGLGRAYARDVTLCATLDLVGAAHTF
jgi:2-phosphosulfolactate phosphatase